MKIDNLCLQPFNEARECLFATDYAMNACTVPMDHFTQCQLDPKKYADFMKLATPMQRRKVSYVFEDRWNILDRTV